MTRAEIRIKAAERRAKARFIALATIDAVVGGQENC